MSHNIAADILNIVEVKLAKHGRLQDLLGGLPAVAALYSEIDAYLKLVGPDQIQQVPESGKTVHAISMVNSDGFAGGKDSALTMYPTLQECIDGAYESYVSIWEESQQAEILDDSEDLLSKEEFEKELLDTGNVCIQCLDSHVNFEYFQQEITFDQDRGKIKTSSSKNLPLDAQIYSAADKASALRSGSDKQREIAEPNRS